MSEKYLEVAGQRIHCGPESLVAREMVTDAVVKRFFAKVDVRSEGCWQWTASLSGAGQGTFNPVKIGGEPSTKPIGVHRMAYLMFVGPIPEKHDIDHLCHTSDCKLGRACPHRSCVRPSHLDPKTRANNLKRGASRWTGDTCAKGHPWTPESTIERADGRTCRICRKERSKRYYAEKMEGIPKPPHHNAVKTHCPKGHEYTPENTIIRPNGTRACRTCGREATLRWYHAGRGAGKVAHKDKTHCPQGHEYTPENTYVPPSGVGRACRTCKAENSRRQAEKRKREI